MYTTTYLLHPLYHVRSGWVSIYHGYLRNAGITSYAWPMTATSVSSIYDARAYNLHFNSSIINLSGGPDLRYYGFPLRWLNVIPYLLVNIYYVRSGHIEMDTGYLTFAGISGLIWPSTASYKTSTAIYYFSFNASKVHPSASPSHAWYGIPLGCINLKC